MKNDEKDPIGQRMKAYERTSNHVLTNRLPVIVRLDGKAFHTFTKKIGCVKPFDMGFVDAMQTTALHLCENVGNCRMAFTQSDEISLLLIPYENHETQPYFGNKLQKIVSITASIASVVFNKEIDPFNKKNLFPVFDSRAFVMPPDDVENYFYWRGLDCRRNAINGVGQFLFGKKQLHKKSRRDILEMIADEGINFEERYPAAGINGSTILRLPEGEKHIWKLDPRIDFGSEEGRKIIRDYVSPQGEK
jgi:tRNA(His) 5'-end guanylyltransferase